MRSTIGVPQTNWLLNHRNASQLFHFTHIDMTPSKDFNTQGYMYVTLLKFKVKAMSPAFSRGKQVIIAANARNCGRVCLF